MMIEDLIKRKEELYSPIHQQIMMTDDKKDVLLLAINMLESSTRIFLDEYGVEGTKCIIDDMMKKF
jgi:hypothetical protein